MIRRSAWVALALLVAVLVASDVAWFQAGGAPLHWDSAIHLGASLDANRVAATPTASMARRALDFTWYYPPFVYWATSPFHRAFGESQEAGLLAMAFFHALLVVATWGLALRWSSPQAALLAALWTGTTPIVLEYARQYMLDLPLAALVALALLLLVRTQRFSRCGASLGLGVALGCGLLTKWTFVCFLFVPFVATAWAARTDRTAGGRTNAEVPPGRAAGGRPGLNTLAALVVAVAIALPWYARHLVPILTRRGGELGHDHRTVLQAAVYYLGILPEQLSWFAVPAVVLGVIAFVRMRLPHRQALVWWVGAYVLLSCIDFKVARFSLPLLPLLVVASAGLDDWRRRGTPGRARSAAVAGFATLLGLQAIVMSCVPRASAMGALWSRVAGAPLVPVAGPRREDWRQADILAAVNADARGAGRDRALLRVVPDHLWFNRPTFDCVAALHRLPVAVTGIAGIPLLVDYVVIKTGDLGEDAIKRAAVQAAIGADSTGAHSIGAGSTGTGLTGADSIGPTPLYRVMGRFALPDDSEAVLLRAAREPVAGATSDSLRARVEQLSDQLVRRFLRPDEGYRVTATEFDAASTLAGRLRSIRVQATSGALGDFAYRPLGVVVHDLDLELRGVRLNPAALAGRGALQVVEVEELRLNGMRLAAADLRTYLEASSKGKTRVREIAMRDGVLRLAVQQTKPKLRAEVAVRLWTRDDNVSFRCEGLRVDGVPLPAALVNVLAAAYDPLLARPEGVGRVRLGRLSLENDSLVVEPIP